MTDPKARPPTDSEEPGRNPDPYEMAALLDERGYPTIATTLRGLADASGAAPTAPPAPFGPLREWGPATGPGDSADLLRENARLLEERDEAREWVRRLAKENVLTCVYCGAAYPPGTPSHGAPVLTEHIKICPKHPLRAAEEELTRARAAHLENAMLLAKVQAFRQAAIAAVAYLAAHSELVRAGISQERPDAARRLADAWIALNRACAEIPAGVPEGSK